MYDHERVELIPQENDLPKNTLIGTSGVRFSESWQQLGCHNLSGNPRSFDRLSFRAQTR